MTQTIGVAGAGIMGRILAWQLHRAGYAVTLFDKDDIDFGDAAAYTAAGMITPYCEVESAERLVFDLGMRSLILWKEIAAELGDIDYFQNGSIVVAHGADRADWQFFNQQVQAKLTPSADQYKLLNHQQLAMVEPELSDRFQEATYLPEEAWVCSRKTMQALADYLLAEGVNWFPNRAIHDVQPHQIITNEGTHHFDWVIDCRGLGAKPQLQDLRGVRGEVVVIQAPEVKLKHLVRLMHPRYRLYIVPRGYDNQYVIGATQIESNDRGPITVRSCLELLSAAYSIHSGFAEARVLDMKTNCRPALRDNLPLIQCDNGMITVNGLFRHGYLLSPVLAEEVLKWLQTPDYQSIYSSLIKQVA